MSDTAIADVQRRATEKLPHFVYPPAKPKLTSSGQSLILVSDNLEKHELLIKATLATTTVVAVKYDSWSLANLSDAINKRAPAGTNHCDQLIPPHTTSYHIVPHLGAPVEASPSRAHAASFTPLHSQLQTSQLRRLTSPT